LWLHSLKVAQLLCSAACLHTNQSRSYLNHLVILRCVRVTIVCSGENILRVCFLALRLNAYNAHEPCCYLRPVWLYNIFPHYLIKGKIFEKKIFKIKCAFWISAKLSSEKVLILRRNERDMIKNVYSCSCKVLVILVRY